MNGNASSSEDDFDISLSESDDGNYDDEDYCPSNWSDESEDGADDKPKTLPPAKAKSGGKSKNKKRSSVDSGNHSMSKEYDSCGSSASNSFSGGSESDEDGGNDTKKKKKRSKKPGKSKTAAKQAVDKTAS